MIFTFLLIGNYLCDLWMETMMMLTTEFQPVLILKIIFSCWVPLLSWPFSPKLVLFAVLNFFSQIVLTDCRRTLFNLVLVILLFSNGVSHRWFLLSCRYPYTHTNQDILKMEITYSISPVRNKIRVCCEASGQYVLIGLINWNRFSLCDI